MSRIKNILNSLFGQQSNPAWEQFAAEQNGTVVIGKGPHYDRVEVVYLNHQIIFDQYTYYQVVGAKSYDTTFTRVRMEFRSRDDLQFRITEQNVIDLIGKIFGLQDIRVGNREFDRRFLIKGNDELKVQSLFSRQTIRNVILSQKNVHLQVLKGEGIYDEPIAEGNSMLYYLSETRVTHVNQLNSLLILYKEVIDQLTKLGSISSMSR